MDPRVFLEAVNRTKAMVAVRDHQFPVRLIPDQQKRRKPLTGRGLAAAGRGRAPGRHPSPRGSWSIALALPHTAPSISRTGTSRPQSTTASVSRSAMMSSGQPRRRNLQAVANSHRWTPAPAQGYVASRSCIQEGCLDNQSLLVGIAALTLPLIVKLRELRRILPLRPGAQIRRVFRDSNSASPR